LWGGVVPIVPRAPGPIWVHGAWAGEVMVDGSIRERRHRPLGLWWTAARGRASRKLRELADLPVAALAQELIRPLPETE
jgi:hypothetical protein